MAAAAPTATVEKTKSEPASLTLPSNLIAQNTMLLRHERPHEEVKAAAEDKVGALLEDAVNIDVDSDDEVDYAETPRLPRVSANQSMPFVQKQTIAEEQKEIVLPVEEESPAIEISISVADVQDTQSDNTTPNEIEIIVPPQEDVATESIEMEDHREEEPASSVTDGTTTQSHCDETSPEEIEIVASSQDNVSTEALLKDDQREEEPEAASEPEPGTEGEPEQEKPAFSMPSLSLDLNMASLQSETISTYLSPRGDPVLMPDMSAVEQVF